MLEFKSILAYVDPDQEDALVLRRAADLAKASKAPLTLFSAIEPLPAFAALLISETAKEHEDLVLAAAADRLAALAEPLRDKGLDVITRVASGRPAIEITREALRDGHDLVLKEIDEGESHTHLSHRDMELLRKCPATVWLVRRGMDEKIEHVLAPVDPEPDDAVRNELSKRVVEFALAIAKDEKSTLDVIRAWGLVGTAVHLHGLSDEELEAYMNGIEKNFQTTLDTFLKDFEADQKRFEAHLIKGPSETVIPEWVAEHNIDLLVMGTVARTGVAGLLIGNTAERVMPQVPCSIVALKPEGFVTTVDVPDEKEL